MIEIEREEKGTNGRYRWHVRGRVEIKGVSRQPLLDACRELKRMGEDPLQLAALFRPGRTNWDVRCSIGYGAGKAIVDSPSQSIGLKNYAELTHWGDRDS